MYTGSITIPRRVCVWVIYTGNRDLPRWSFSDAIGLPLLLLSLVLEYDSIIWNVVL